MHLINSPWQLALEKSFIEDVLQNLESTRISAPGPLKSQMSGLYDELISLENMIQHVSQTTCWEIETDHAIFLRIIMIAVHY